MSDSLKNGNNRWNYGFNKAKKSIHNAIDLDKKRINKKIEPYKELKDNYSKAEGFSEKTKVLGKAAVNKYKKTDSYAKMQEIAQKAKRVAELIASSPAYLLYCGIAVIVLILIGGLSTFGVGVGQSLTPTPHYYCDTEASASLKKTAVYQQYCNDIGGFNFDNLNGHYIVQDGSGPCTDCATANMMMRYYTLHELNFFDYLWNERGLYEIRGQTLTTSHLSIPTTIRHCINGTTTVRSTCEVKRQNRSKPTGTCVFALKNGIHGWTMSNWGYLRDEDFDLEEWEQTSDYYLNNENNEHWVWDLSIGNKGPGSSWSVVWNGTTMADGIVCNETTAEGGAITGEVIKQVMEDPSVCKEAGVLMYYDYGGGSHAILVTKYEGGEWYVIDSALGVAGGYEGPSSQDYFCWKNVQVTNLLNSGSNSADGLTIKRICYIANM